MGNPNDDDHTRSEQNAPEKNASTAWLSDNRKAHLWNPGKRNRSG